jgi:quercetin dioxygenase-like cupin family protein
MAIPHAKAGEVISVRPLGAALNATSTYAIVKTDILEVIRIVLPAGKRLPPHQVPGEITVQCLEGKVEFVVGELKRELTAGSFLYVEGSGEHAVHAIEDASLLVTIVLKHKA